MATAANKPTTREMPRLELRAEVAPSTVNVEKRTVEITWTTGARVKRGFWEPYLEELSLNPKHVRMDRLKSGSAPLLNSHRSYDLSDVIGVVESAKLEKTRGTATVRFDSGAEGEEVFRKVREGILRNISVGYRVHKMVKVEDGEDKTPVYRAEDWEPYELSVVPIGADAGAGTRAQDNDSNPCEFVTRQEKAAMDDEDKTNNAPAKPETPATAASRAVENVAAEATRAVKLADAEERKKIAEAKRIAAEEAIEAERARASGIRAIAKQSKLGDTWANTLIDAGATVDQARKAAFDEIAGRADEEFNTDGTLRIGAGDDARDKFLRGASAWLFQRTGTAKLMEAAKKKMPDQFKDVALDPGEFRGYSPIELARLSLERQGVNTRGMDRMRMIGMAFTHRSGNYQTTGDFPILLENVLGKVLLGAYATQSNTWERFCKVDEVPDFRTSNRYRTGSLPGLAVIGEHGEYTNAAVPDGSKYPVLTKRLGRIFGISRETILNDDMSALTDMATKMGQAAMRTIETSVFDLIAANSGLGPTQSDSQPFFHANRSNVNATGSALAVAGLDADRVVLRAQKDPNGLDYLDLNPAILLVPDSLRGTALQLNDAQFDPVSNKFQVPNMVRGLFREVIGTPRLTGTRRYMVADTMDWIVVAFLEGYGRGPAMESQEGWRVDGTEWKVTLYANAQMGDPKGAVTNAGQ
jgi:HK97 family phage prohead protease